MQGSECIAEINQWSNKVMSRDGKIEQIINERKVWSWSQRHQVEDWIRGHSRHTIREGEYRIKGENKCSNGGLQT